MNFNKPVQYHFCFASKIMLETDKIKFEIGGIPLKYSCQTNYFIGNFHNHEFSILIDYAGVGQLDVILSEILKMTGLTFGELLNFQCYAQDAKD